MFVDFEIEGQFEILEVLLGLDDAPAFGVAVLATGEHAVFHRPLGGTEGVPTAQGVFRKERVKLICVQRRGKRQQQEQGADHFSRWV